MEAEGIIIDDCNDMVFTLVGEDENLAMKWWFGYNTHFNARPVDLLAENRLKEIHSYLHFNLYGPY